MPTRNYALLIVAALVAAVTGAALIVASSSGSHHARHPVADRNPCAVPKIRHKRGLLCPDLTISRPSDIQEGHDDGERVLRATSSVNSVGRGPTELNGRRVGQRSMRANQRVHKRGGGVAKFHTDARLHFTDIPGQGGYWKFHNAARFQLWSLDDRGHRKRLVDTGPKHNYCLRDLVHTGPGRPHSPSSAVYPGCSQDPGRKHVTLGTSVGWSDVYPASYYEQYVELDKIRGAGCYSFVMTVDPKNKILELNEKNNSASKVVYLTKHGRYRPGRCHGVRDRGLSVSSWRKPSSRPRAISSGPSPAPGGTVSRNDRSSRADG